MNSGEIVLLKPLYFAYKKVKSIITDYSLHTICESGNCPNIGECWGAGTATFMILGNICTRSCGFCFVMTGIPFVVDIIEARNVALSVELLAFAFLVVPWQSCLLTFSS